VAKAQISTIVEGKLKQEILQVRGTAARINPSFD
jgi:hypothetical protein